LICYFFIIIVATPLLLNGSCECYKWPCGIDKIRSDRTSDQKPDVYRFETEEAMNLNAFIRGNKATQQQQPPPPPAVIGMMWLCRLRWLL
jgi:hypothetical protein